MGTPSNSELPARMRRVRNAYYYDHGLVFDPQTGRKKRWRQPLGSDYQQAYAKWAAIEEGMIGGEYHPNWRSKLYDRAKRGAKQRRIPFHLTREQFDQLVEHAAGRCAVTGIRFQFSSEHGAVSPWAPSLDRIDSNLGYSFENCRLVCLAVNYALNRWGTDVLLRIADGIREQSTRFGQRCPKHRNEPYPGDT